MILLEDILSKKAFFIQGDSLLLPEESQSIDYSYSQVDKSLPIELASKFNEPDIFDIPEIYGASRSKISIVSVSPRARLPENWTNIHIRQLLAMNCSQDMSNIFRACHIAQWRWDSRFCGTCGATNIYVPKEVHRLCSKCGRLEFPRICPAVIVLITDNADRILLAHNERFKAGVYSLISGFNEAGENLEETAAREIREEVNIEVSDIEYCKSQPWPFPNSLMIGYKARYLSGTIKPDGKEITDADWFTRDNLPDLPSEGSLSRLLINNWRQKTRA